MPQFLKFVEPQAAEPLREERRPLISEEQQQNIETLITNVQTSVDGAIADLDLTPLITTTSEALSDRTLTPNEVEAILTEAIALTEALGITPQEARTIFYDLQTIADASRLPQSDDSLTGTSADDVLRGGLGDDSLLGAGTTPAGTGEVDWLIGGGGSDTFILGDATTVFYNDGTASTPGTQDYAVIADFNPTQDTIQLHGSASDYLLGAVPTNSGLSGTAIFYKSTNGASTPELVGIVAGVMLTDFDAIAFV